MNPWLEIAEEMQRNWKTAPISPLCEYSKCRRPAVVAYPALNGGWCALCLWHSKQHEYTEQNIISNLMRGGETFQTIYLIADESRRRKTVAVTETR